MYIIENKGFLIIDPPIYEQPESNDYDEAIRWLEAIRKRLPQKFSDWPDSIRFALVRYGDFLGNKYPAIGIDSKNREDLEVVPDFIYLYDLIEEWIAEIGIEKIKGEASKIETIEWDELNRIGYYYP